MPALPLLPEHRKHATGDGEATEHIDGRERNRYHRKTENQLIRTISRSRIKGRRNLDQRAHRDNARDRVGDAHQRRVQGRRHVPHHHVTDEAGEHEHREMGEKRCGRVGADQPEEQRARTKRDRKALG